ncbi:MAG: aromatic amino acid ammonia-lyase [Pseudomonadota bacterium]
MSLAIASAPPITLDRNLPLRAVEQIATGQATMHLSPAAQARCAAAMARLDHAISERRHIYGVTTGFGPLANRLVGSGDAARLQQNLVNHLATGVGPPLRWDQARATVLARVMALVQGASGVRAGTLSRLVALLNSDLAPVLPARGTVGASGDLTPLAHLVLCLQGCGDFLQRDGHRLDGRAGLAALGLDPLDLSHRDGLALVNGTSAMTGLAALNAVAAERAIQWALTLTAGMGECLSARTEAWDPAFADLRPHPGQRRAASMLRDLTRGSARLERTPIAEHTLDARLGPRTETYPGQDAYTFRCAPQVIGAAWDTADWHRAVVRVELASVTDNPILPPASDAPALHGGNFMGSHVALASDALSNAVATLAGLAERQIARITDETLNRGLPAFLAGGEIGMNSGLMGAQVTATALLAELRAIGPASVQSLSTNAANQDVVSQGTIAARFTDEKLGHLFHLLGIGALAAAQAMDLREDADAQIAFSPAAQRLRRCVRALSPRIFEDRPLAPDIARVSAWLRQTDPPDAVARDDV